MSSKRSCATFPLANESAAGLAQQWLRVRLGPRNDSEPTESRPLRHEKVSPLTAASDLNQPGRVPGELRGDERNGDLH